MACPTCGHTLAGIEAPAPLRFYHCERCGTFVVRDSTGELDDTLYVPRLVERCRKFAEERLFESEWLSARDWHRLGIAEAISPPDAQPGGPLNPTGTDEAATGGGP